MTVDVRERGETLSEVRITPYTVQGFCPTSVTTHPAMSAVKPDGVIYTSHRNNLAD